MHFSLFELILIIGILQGFVIAFQIWLAGNRKHGEKVSGQHEVRKNQSKLLLSFVLVVFNLLCIKILALSSGLRAIKYLRYLPLSFELAIQPLIYLYVLSLTKPGFKLTKSHWLHFIPFLISFIYSVFIYFAMITTHPLSPDHLLTRDFDFNKIKEMEDYLSIVSALIYWYAGLRRILIYRNWLNQNISDTDYPTYAWLRNIAILLGILIAGLAVDILLDYLFGFGGGHFFHWQIFFVYLAILIYYMGFRGFQLSDRAFPVPVQNREPGSQPVSSEAGSPDKGRTEGDSGKEAERLVTAETLATAERKEAIKQAILKAMKSDKLYLDPELNMQTLAKKMGVPAALVSAVINSELKKSFRSLVNEYRIEAVKSMMQSSKADRLSILGIAYECGFNSEASFYRIFRAMTGLTPGDYLKNRPS